MIRTDYAVIGHSLAGISAALALAKSGDRVVLLDFHRDTDTVAESPRIQPTSLGPAMDVVRGDSENIAFAGLAAGIDYWKHAELVNDGARAARTLQLHPEETK